MVEPGLDEDLFEQVEYPVEVPAAGNRSSGTCVGLAAGELLGGLGIADGPVASDGLVKGVGW